MSSAVGGIGSRKGSRRWRYPVLAYMRGDSSKLKETTSIVGDTRDL